MSQKEFGCEFTESNWRYESPITMIADTIWKDIEKTNENATMEAVYKVGVEVDKDELIRALQYDRNQYEKGYFDGRHESLKWISVKERLPDAVDIYLVITDESYMYIAAFTGSRWFCHDSGSFIRNESITHWMPLPDPPEVEE